MSRSSIKQLYAPMQDYPDLAFWPQARPATCIDDVSGQTTPTTPFSANFFCQPTLRADQLRNALRLD